VWIENSRTLQPAVRQRRSATFALPALSLPTNCPERTNLRPFGATSAVHLCCMAATRTQIYLTEEQRELVDRIAASEGLTMAEVVRRALNAYLSSEADATAALKATFGTAPDFGVPSRDEWNRG